MSLNQISKSNGALAGRGIALAGILSGVICGIIGTALLAGLAAPLVLRQRHKAEEVEVRVQLAEFHRQVTAYRIDNGTLPDPANAGRMLEIPESRLNGEVIYFPEVDFEKPDQTLLVVPLRHATLILDSNGVTVTADDVDTAEGVPIFPQ